MTDAAESLFREGEVIDEKYRVERILGVGGMGVVVAAMHLHLEERTALKFLLPQVAASPGVTARFLQEARAAARIKSEHIARVIDVGKLPTGAPYMVMEFLDGQDLEQVIRGGAELPLPVVVGWVLEACEAIAEAHSLGIVHRDLKPANLFLARRPNGPPTIKVLDFGISKVASRDGSSLTKTSSMLGSPFYMSPEQMNSSKSVDHRADVWAMGVVLYELITRELPFPGESMPEVVGSVLQAAPRPIDRFRSDVPPGLAAVVQRCLEKEASARYANVHELAVALAPYAHDGGAVSLPRISHVSGVPAQATFPSAEAAVAGRSPTVHAVGGDSVAVAAVPSRMPLVWGAVVGVTVIALGLFAAFRGSTRGVAEPSAPTLAAPAPAPSPSSDPGAEAVVAAPPPTGAPEPSSATTPSASAARVTATAPHPTTHAEAPLGKAPPKAKDCDPPYTVDRVTGHHDYKPECL